MRIPVLLLAAVAVLGMSSSAFAELVDNPAYQSWAKFKPGTTATVKTTVEMSLRPGVAVESTNTQKLLEVKPDALTIENTMIVKTTGLPDTTQPATATQPSESKTILTVQAKVEKGLEYLPLGNTTDASNTKFEVTDVKPGTDKLTIKGETVDAVTREFTLTSSRISPPATPTSGTQVTNMKTWTVPQVPGGIAKAESNYSAWGGTFKSTITLLDYTIAK
jgi:hypothetical protein